MSQHPTEKEFAEAIVKGFTSKERQHLSECSQCAAELEAFQEACLLQVDPEL